MQDPSTAFQQMKPQFPEQEQLKCPRCDSNNTKFCYYNNYNLSQPRHFCKNCRRYWTKGGALRNIPVGGGSRKNTKRSSNTKRSNPDPSDDPNRINRRVPDAASSSSTSTTTATSNSHLLGNGNSDMVDPTRMYGLEADQERKILDLGGSFSSLLSSNGQYGGFFDGLNPTGSSLKMVQIGGFAEDLNSGQNPNLDVQGSNNNGSGVSLKEAVEKAESFFSGAGIDYMIHNAAYERPKSTALDTTEESLKATFNINVLGTLSLTRLLAPFMLKRGRGHFVVMSSAAGKVPAPGQAVYSASKFALNGYFQSLRSELYQKGIRVTIVCPGPVDTSNGYGVATSERKSSEKRVSSERCAELTIIAATHGLKEAWISYQPVLAVMYLVQYMPSIGYWLMDKIGGKRVEVAEKKGDTYSWNLLFGKKKAT